MGKGLAGFLARWSPALLVMAVIFVASATPGEELPDAGRFDMLVRKGGHFLGYALLGAAYLRGLAWRRRPAIRDLEVALLMALLYAASDEIHQRFTPGRRPAVSDVLLDGVGAALGAAAWARRSRRRLERPD
ncbi:MAG: VanZ family protein [Solirubrobacterales bacterium]